MPRPPDHSLLVLSGPGGVGKTEFAKWLELRGWKRIEMDELLSGKVAVSAIEQRWLQALQGPPGPAGFRERVLAARLRVVIEWGFAIVDLPRIRELEAVGFYLWWLDGDREACRASWRQLRGEDDAAWRNQTAAIDSHWSEIGKLYRDRIVQVVDAAGRRLPCDEMASQTDIGPRERSP